MFVPLPASSSVTLPSEDNYSSEEELKEIINETSSASSTGASGTESTGLTKKKSPSKKERKMTKAKNNDNDKSNSTANIKKDSSLAAEKRKWSEVISDDDLADLDEEDDGLELEMTSRSYSRVYVRSSGGNSTTASSSCSNEDESCVCGRRLTTPVQFCTSPPMDVHRPRRKPWTPPPPKVFHVMSNHSASFDLTTQEEDDEIVDIENRASRPLRPAAFMPGRSNLYLYNVSNTTLTAVLFSQWLRVTGMHLSVMEWHQARLCHLRVSFLRPPRLRQPHLPASIVLGIIIILNSSNVKHHLPTRGIDLPQGHTISKGLVWTLRRCSR